MAEKVYLEKNSLIADIADVIEDAHYCGRLREVIIKRKPKN